MSDEKILKLLQAQNEEGITAIADKYEKLLKYVASNILGDRTRDIEECVNDTYYKIWKNSNNFDFNKASLKTYLKVIVRNTALNKLRELKKSEPEVNSQDYGSLLENYSDYCNNPEKKALDKENIKLLEDVMSELNKKDRELLLRRYFYLQSSKDISEKMGMSINAIDSKLSRLRIRIKDEFERRTTNE